MFGNSQVAERRLRVRGRLAAARVACAVSARGGREGGASVMGVTWLLHWQPSPPPQPPGSTAPPPSSSSLLSLATYTDVAKAIESLPAVRKGRWQCTCSLYRPNTRDTAGAPPSQSDVAAARELFGVSFADVAGRHFLVLRQERMVVEAESTVQTLMETLQLYRHRLSIVYEGFEYLIGDFAMRLGRAILSTNEALRGIVVEIEYLPTSSLPDARPLLLDFLAIWHDLVAAQGLVGRFVPLDPAFSDYSLGDTFSLPHSALQFVLVSAHLMAARA
ncbi:unnamed protein product [Closterium sp. Yama58-4]|nr:unnamed protein product [Closterium sp. Yama58-4]